MRKRLLPLFVRSLIATALAWILASVPLPAVEAYRWFAFVQVPIVILILICYIGKLLIDTIIQDRHEP